MARTRSKRKPWHPEVCRGALHLGELLLGCGKAGAQSFDFAEPTIVGGLGDPLFQTVDDALEPFVLVGVGAEHRAADAGMLVLTAASIFIGELSGGQERKVIVDLGLSAMLLFGMFIAIFVGVGLVYKEIERRTIYAVFSKPVGRGEFLVGK